MLVSTLSLAVTGISATYAAGAEVAASAGEYSLFDYLGELVEIDGEWLDPLAMNEDVAVTDDVNAGQAPQADQRTQIGDESEATEDAP